MKAIVLGGGVIGISTAFYLAKSGTQVTLLDRQPGPALETSFANAGQVSPGYSTPWAAPGIPLKAIKWMFQKHAPLAVRLDGSLFQLQWMAQMLRNCSPERYAVNKERMVRVAEYSVSEKYDGVRAYWDGQQLWSRQGHLILAPVEFKKRLPDFAVEGELWFGRQSFARA